MNPAGVKSILRSLGEAVEITTDFFLNPCCMACNGPLAPILEQRGSMDLLCDPCRDLLHPIDKRTQCPRCGAPSSRAPKNVESAGGRCDRCESLPATFEKTIAVFPYLSSAGMIVRNMKYTRGGWLAGHLVNLAWPHLAPRILEWLHEEETDWAVLPVPMYSLREMRRGYNQARELAAPIAERLKLPLLGDRSLQRHRRAKPQARFHTQDERFSNLQGVFRVRDESSIRGKSIILVDDVMTSGATITAASAELLRKGARRVRVVVMLRAQISQDQVVAPGP